METGHTLVKKVTDYQSVCDDCSQIDLDALFKLQINQGRSSNNKSERRAKYGLRVHNLAHVSATKKCNLCQLFLNLAESSGEIWDTSRMRLVARSARRCFALSFPEDATILTVNRYAGNTLKSNASVRSFLMRYHPTENSPIQARKIGDNLDWGLVRSWFDECLMAHSSCCSGAAGSAFDHFRVIDCQNCTLHYVDRGTKYTTLSYVWGTDLSHTASVGDAHALPKVLPLTIEDAITATLALGYQFLWVDRYCVAQGVHTEDESAESRDLIENMGTIYSCSEVTIIAIVGTDPCSGLPGVHPNINRPQSFMRTKSGLMVMMDMKNVLKEVRESVWNTRGWTFQEGLLSKRKLVFSTHGVYFQCESKHRYEALEVTSEACRIDANNIMQATSSFPRVFPSRGVGTGLDDLIKAIIAYSQKHLTYEEDRLKAFLGILSRFARGGYIAGHFWGLPVIAGDRAMVHYSFTRALLWKHEGQATRGAHAPSWSCFSSDGNGCLLSWNPEWTALERETVLDSDVICHVAVESQRPDGSKEVIPLDLELLSVPSSRTFWTQTGRLFITGSTIQMTLLGPNWRKATCKPWGYYLGFDIDSDIQEGHSHQTLDCVGLVVTKQGTSSQLLLLRKVDSTSYERMGILDLEGNGLVRDTPSGLEGFMHCPYAAQNHETLHNCNHFGFSFRTQEIIIR